MPKDNLVEYIENFLDSDYVLLEKNISKLLEDYKRKSKRLEKIMLHSDKQQLKLINLNEELDDHKKNLELKVEDEIKKREEKEKMLLQQARLASMGEMMDAVAHQWKQPIGVISMQVQMMSYDLEDGLINEEYVQKLQDDVKTQIDHMVNTLDEFRTFFRPAKDPEIFSIESMVKKVFLLVKDEFIKNSINLELNTEKDFTLFGSENEFKHLIINIINNSKDAFIENSTKNRKITITISSCDKYNTIKMQDNAGGIPESVIKDIFKANVTTKTEGKGTGIGLYMSSQIAQKHTGELSVVNENDGASFLFKYKKYCEEI
ncbi:MAG: GHKL domain-containing protein [Helicobacteraceae bacterium]|nr:GHKL domain-containing protein [Helicobacteraceae bacterium]